MFLARKTTLCYVIFVVLIMVSAQLFFADTLISLEVSTVSAGQGI